MAIFGSSNWTSASASGQHEHNLFTTRSWIYAWFRRHFDRKWNNRGGAPETTAFVPQPPGTPRLKSPADGATGQPRSIVLRWDAGKWAHRYDVYLGKSGKSMKKVLDDRNLGPSDTSTDYITYKASGLSSGTTYYWKVVSRTMADKEKASATFRFTTGGRRPPPEN